MNPLEEKKFEKLYKANFNRIYRFFILRCLNREIAEDLTSSTFLAFAEQVSNLKKIENPQGYLYGIARIKFTEYLTQKYNEVPINIENLDMFYQTAEAARITSSRALLVQYLYELVNLLPRKQKILMKLRIHNRLKLAQIAQILNKDLNYVKTTQRRAIRKLKDLAAKMYTL